MPLSEPKPREIVHTRHITCHGYRRADGLWDIEAHLVDTKAYPFRNAYRGELKPGEPLHEMWLRLTVDDSFCIREVEAATDAAPFDICPAITPAFDRLKGLRIGPGFRKAARERVGGIKGCTHLVELLVPAATVAFQTIAPLRAKALAPGRKPPHLDTCHALRTDGEVVREHYPEWYRAP